MLHSERVFPKHRVGLKHLYQINKRQGERLKGITEIWKKKSHILVHRLCKVLAFIKVHIGLKWTTIQNYRQVIFTKNCMLHVEKKISLQVNIKSYIKFEIQLNVMWKQLKQTFKMNLQKPSLL